MPDSIDRRTFLALGAGALTGLAGCSLAPADGDSATGDTATTESTAAAAGAQPTDTAGGPTGPAAPGDGSVFTEVYRNAIDSVVLVKANGGQGTGFMFDERHVVTNAHVVGQDSAVGVRFNDGQWASGDVVGRDRAADLAAVEVGSRPEAATPLPFVESVTIGQRVAVIGNPYSLNGSLTTGVVSGTDRLIPSPGPTGYQIPDAVQTDAAVNPGNSGGPLMSLDGRVVAVINSGGGENIAFGISAALTKRIVPELIDDGEYNHVYLGASFTDVRPSIAAANDLDETRGLLTVDVARASPAAGALQPSEIRYTNTGRLPVGGDVVLSVDGRDLVTTEDIWSYLVLETRPGDSVEFEIVRDGSRRTVSVELGARPT